MTWSNNILLLCIIQQECSNYSILVFIVSYGILFNIVYIQYLYYLLHLYLEIFFKIIESGIYDLKNLLTDIVLKI